MMSEWCESPGCALQPADHRRSECDPQPAKVRLTKAQKRALLAAYQSPEGEAYGLSYGPMEALTKTHRLAHEIFLPHATGFHIRINARGRSVAAEINSTARKPNL